MSGPKVSDYELERRRQEELRRQYLEEQRRIEEHRRQQEEFRSSIRRNVSRIRSLKSEVQTRVREISSDANCQFDIKAFQKLCADADSLIKRSMSVHDSSDITPRAAGQCANEANQMIEILLQQNQKVQDERLMLESASFMNSMRSLRAISKSSPSAGRDRQSVKAKNDEYAHRALEAYHIGCTVLATARSEMPDKAAEILRLQRLLDSEVKELGGSPGEVCHAALDCQHEIEHQVNLWRKEAERIRAAQDRRADLVRRYHYYCNELGFTRMSVEELSSQADSGLESLCATLDNMLYRQYEENYIFQCINQAMADIGYELYGRAANGIRGQFLYRMHGDTVVHVACSDQGIISMEIGRAANTQRELDAEEVDELVQDMHTFCGDYAALQRKLADMGVKCKSNIELNPPDAAFAMLMDTSEYELCQGAVSVEEQRKVQYLDAGE